MTMSQMMKLAAKNLRSTQKLSRTLHTIAPKLSTNAPNLSLSNSESYSEKMGRTGSNSIPWSICDRRQFCSAAAAKPASLQFTVRRREPELVAPAKPTPREIKQLSDIDNQDIFRYIVPLIHFYRYDPTLEGKDPARVIREALAKTLVFFYPLAGRLREGHGREIYVDCTEEGVLFVEADADVELAQFGDPPQPPFPCCHELFYFAPDSTGIFNSPLMLVQVTHLKCGGFVFSIRFNHVLCDAAGMAQFLTALGQIARGAKTPSIIPVWNREIFNARNPPRITCTHPQYENVDHSPAIPLTNHNLIGRSLFFGPPELQAIRRIVPDHMRSDSTTFEALTACLWRCRTIALQLDPKEKIRLLCSVNTRGKLNHVVPVGYYGNATAWPVVETTSGRLCESSIEHGLELVKKVKEVVTEEYMHSLADLLVIRGRPRFFMGRCLVVSDLRRSGYGDVDFGWGKAAYAGPAAMEAETSVSAMMIAFRNIKGEDGILVPTYLPPQQTEIFESELNNMLH